MNKIVIDTDVIRNDVKKLRKLKDEYKTKIKKNVRPTSKKDAGKTNDAIKRADELMDMEWKALFALVENSIAFLSDTAESYDTNDNNTAKSLN